MSKNIVNKTYEEKIEMEKYLKWDFNQIQRNCLLKKDVTNKEKVNNYMKTYINNNIKITLMNDFFRYL